MQCGVHGRNDDAKAKTQQGHGTSIHNWFLPATDGSTEIHRQWDERISVCILRV
jgi:hypothetical protein